MKKRNSIIALTIAVAALVAVPVVFAGPGGPGGHHGRGGHGMGMGILGHLGRIQEELDLSDAQADQIRTIFKDLHAQNETYHEQLHNGLKDVTATLLENPNNLAAAQAIIDQQVAAEKALKTNMLNATAKALTVLTPEQRAKLAQMLAEHSERFEQRRSRRGR